MVLPASTRPRSLLLAAAFLCGQALAGAPAGVVQDTLKRPTPPPIKTEAPVVQTPAPAAAPPPAAPGERTVVVTRFEFVGNTQVKTEALQAAVARFLNTPLTIEQLFDVADAATAAYRESGFGLATVVVPAQKVDGGTVRLEVIEGLISSVMFEGNRGYSLTTLGRFTPEVRTGRIYRTEDVERAVLRLNDLPGLDARVIVQPGASYGTSDLTFKVLEDPAEYLLTVDDHGRDAIGRERVLFDAVWNNLSGRGDDLRLGLVHTEANLLNYINLTYGLPLGIAGDRLAFTANYADYSVADPAFVALGVTGDNTNARVDFTHPLTRSRYENLVLTGALAYAGTSTDLAAVGLTASTDLFWVEAGAFWNYVFPDLSALTVSGTFAGNLQSQEPGATDPDGIDSAAMKAKLTFDASYSWQFTPGWALVTRVDGVYSPEPLPDIQKFSVGGPYTMRGYESSAGRGDYGHHVSFELQKGFSAFGAVHTFHAFVEGASISTHSYAIGALPVASTRLPVRDAGVALTLNPVGRWGAMLQYAVPIDEVNLPDDDGRLWLSVVARF